MGTLIEEFDDVFEALGVHVSEEEYLKMHIAIMISKAIQSRGITQVQAAELIGTDQSKVSALLRGHVKGFSLDRLLRILTSFGQNVDIRVSTAKHHAGRIRVEAA